MFLPRSAPTGRTTPSTCSTRAPATSAVAVGLDIVPPEGDWTPARNLTPCGSTRSSRSSRPVFSFEFFPPKTEEGEANLWRRSRSCREDKPDVRVRHLRRRRLDARPHDRHRQADQERPRHRGDGALHVRGRDGRRAARHARRDARRRRSRTCSRCAATRPQGETEWTQTEGGLAYSTELIELIARRLRLRASARPASRRCTSRRPTWRRTCASRRRRSRRARRFLITQLFFDNEFYFDFVERAREAGIDVPIIPGIMPVTNYGRSSGSPRCAARRSPSSYERELDGAQGRPRRDHATWASPTRRSSARDLLARGAPGIHFYTLNRSPATRAILAALRAARPWDRAVTARLPASARVDLHLRTRAAPGSAGRQSTSESAQLTIIGVRSSVPSRAGRSRTASSAPSSSAPRTRVDVVVHRRAVGLDVLVHVAERAAVAGQAEARVERVDHVERVRNSPAGSGV